MKRMGFFFIKAVWALKFMNCAYLLIFYHVYSFGAMDFVEFFSSADLLISRQPLLGYVPLFVADPFSHHFCVWHDHPLAIGILFAFFFYAQAFYELPQIVISRNF